MSKLTGKDLHFPLNNETSRKLQGLILRRAAFQGTAATAGVNLALQGVPFLLQAGRLRDLYYIYGTAAAAGESMVVDVQKSTNGGSSWATMLSSTVTISSTSTPLVVTSMWSLVLPASVALAEGTMMRMNLTYTAGGGPAPMANLAVVAEVEGTPA